MGNIVLTDELLDYLGEKFDKETTEDFLKGIEREDTFLSYLSQYIRKLAA